MNLNVIVNMKIHYFGHLTDSLIDAPPDRILTNVKYVQYTHALIWVLSSKTSCLNHWLCIGSKFVEILYQK